MRRRRSNVPPDVRFGRNVKKRWNNYINRPKNGVFHRTRDVVQLQLTTYGRQKVDNLDDMSLQSQIMLLLADGPIKPGELKNKLEMRGIKASEAQIRNYIGILRRNGLIQIVKPSDGIPVGGV